MTFTGHVTDLVLSSTFKTAILLLNLNFHLSASILYNLFCLYYLFEETPHCIGCISFRKQPKELEWDIYWIWIAL